MAVAAYLLGTFPSAHLVAYWTGHDPEVEGSGNPGASNVLRIAGKRAGAIVFAIDVLKGLLPVLVGLALSGRPLAAVGWVAATIGHILPAYRKFRGGKGVATAAGGAVAMFPLICIGLLIAFAVIARVVKKASVASLGVAAGFAILVVVTGRPLWEIVVTISVVAIIVIRHSSNIARLVRRKEHSITK
jgi:glycerol-3-phosphate acyltransferase PlsY